jgi:hypothetical protein
MTNANRTSVQQSPGEHSPRPGEQENATPAAAPTGSVQAEPKNQQAPTQGRATTQQQDPAPQGQAQQATEKAKEIASNAGRKVEEQADAMREQGAGTLSSTAERVRSISGEDGTVGAAGAKVADTMEKTASYLQDNNVEQLMTDIEAYVKEHPVQAVFLAFAAGYVASKVL